MKKKKIKTRIEHLKSQVIDLYRDIDCLLDGNDYDKLKIRYQRDFSRKLADSIFFGSRNKNSVK
jgi:hypothetical protein